jgi:hypothetical protein
MDLTDWNVTEKVFWYKNFISHYLTSKYIQFELQFSLKMIALIDQ